jgi:hypothetical protein
MVLLGYGKLGEERKGRSEGRGVLGGEVYHPYIMKEKNETTKEKWFFFGGEKLGNKYRQ